MSAELHREDSHARARALADRSLLPEISAEEQAWFEEHLRLCSDCATYAELTVRALRGLESLSFPNDPALATRTRQALTRRARQLDQGQSQQGRFLRGFALASLFTIVGSLLAWHGWASLAERVQLVPWQSQIGFSLFWVFPSAIITLLFLVGVAVGDPSHHERSLI